MFAKLKFFIIPERRCWPFWDLWFNLKFYLESVTKVRAGHDRKCEISRERAMSIQRKIYIMLVVFAIRSAQLGILSMVDLSPFTRMLNLDYVMYFDCPKEINLSPVTLGIQAICFTYRMYWFDYHRAFEPILIVKRVLFDSWNGCFLVRKVQHGRYRVTISQIVHSYTASYLNVFKYFHVTVFVVIAIFSTYWLRHLCDYWKFFLMDFPIGPLSLAHALANWLLTNSYIIAFALVNITWSIIIFTFTICMFLRLKQGNKLLLNSTLSPYKFGKFCSFHTETVTKIIAGNRYFGQMLLDFIVIYMPINIFHFTEMILGRYGLMTKFLTVNILAFHYVTLFGIHLMAAMYSARIHKCRYWLLGWSARAQFGKRLDARLKLAHYISAFHTENRYGISYGEIGLISFDSFFKVIALNYYENKMFIYFLVSVFVSIFSICNVLLRMELFVIQVC